MVFSSVPVYVDPPNWHQRPTHQQPGVITHENLHNPHLPPPPQPPQAASGGGGIRPGSMSERARLAKIPQPEAALKCPRCESTNTKFCYFNNYSLSQPRHFCKTCRRYWTRGGALRSVPVGGGCRRNKSSKGGNRSSKSSSSSATVLSERRTGSTSSSSTLASDSCTDMLGHMNPGATPQLPLLPPLQHPGDYNSGNIGINFGGFQPTSGSNNNTDFQIGTSSSVGGSMLTNGLVEQWRLQQVQQFPFLTSTNLENPTGFYPFEGEGVEAPGYASQLRYSKPLESAITQLAAVKMEETQGLNLSKNFLGISGSDQYWGGAGGNAWTDLSGFIKEKSTHR